MRTGNTEVVQARLELLERDELLDGFERAFEEAGAGRGRLVLLGGEAGVGKTAGNPFFVTEALAAGEVELPESVRGAVLARAAHLPAPGRRLLEAAAVVPARIELWLLEAIAGPELAALEDCLSSGMLREDGDGLQFRHELARLAIEESVAPHRRIALHRAVLDTLCSRSRRESIDPARLAHHADAAGDVAAVLRHAPAAGERAAELCAHQEAAQQFARALRHADLLPVDRRAELWERRSYECYLTQQTREAIAARREALALHRERGDRLREGDSHRWLSRLAWFDGDRATAVHCLEGDPAAVAGETGAALAMALAVGDRLAAGELYAWRQRAGLDDRVDLDAVAEPFASELRGDWLAAARGWDELGCSYEAALARADSGEAVLIERALAAFQRLGAVPAARMATQRLRLRGVRSIARGPRRSTLGNPGQLTARQIEILSLLSDGLTNAEIGGRLYITPKTAAHHVSAILGKLGVPSRRQAVAAAAELRLLEK